MRSARIAVPLVLFATHCGDSDTAAADGGATSTTTAATSTSTTTTTTTTGPQATGTGDGGSTGGGIMAQCSIWEQDCPDGDKCMPWSDQPDLVPDEIRCCPEDANAGQVGDECVVTDYLGACIDNCVKGSMCIDLDSDGMGVCEAFCTGSAANPQCALDEGCLIYFAGVPFCFPRCDPLLQDCGDGSGCFPDEASAGGTGFICLPTILPGGQGDLCWLLSGCRPGLLCVAPAFLPDCVSNIGCCSNLCDVAEQDVCPQIDPDLVCVSWYFGGQQPPSVDLASVGVCALPL